MTITSTGYDGTVNEVAWANLSPLYGDDYGVGGALDFQPTIGGAGARAVTLQPGKLFGSGVLDTSDAVIVVNAASLGSGVRWDTVVMNRNWSGGGGTSQAVIRTGTSAQAVTRTSTTPGSNDDQVIALIRIDGGSADVGALIDLRQFSRKMVTLWTDPVTAGLTPLAGRVVYDASQGEFWRVQTDHLTGSGSWINLSLPAPIALPLAGTAGQLVPFNSSPLYRRSFGRVQVEGTVQRNSSAPLVAAATSTDVLIATLPPGYRPRSQRLFVVPELGAPLPASNNTFARCYVSTNGEIRLTTDGRDIQAVALDALSFYADL